MKKRKRVPSVFLLLVMLIAVAAAGCSSSTPSPASEAEPPTPEPAAESTEQSSSEPVTIKILYPWGEGAFEERYRGIEQLLPNIKLELVDSRAELEPLQELNAQQVVPDIIFANWGLDPLVELDMIEPLDDLIAKHQYDINQLDPSLVASIRAMDKEGKGRIMGVPIQYSPYGIWYNKEVFDKFGIEYPAAQMTWDEVIELAKQMTAERDGVQYRGLEMGPGLASSEVTVPLSQLAVNLTDPETGEVLITQEPAVTKYLELMKRLYSIPGIFNPDPAARKDYEFPKKNVAAFYERKPALPPAKISTWDKYVDIGGSMLTFSQSNMDIAEFLRVLKEESEIKIKEAQNQKK
ncbi:extracellular solute-binding protein [Paenibacillus profundus]|uniref:Extracellular solute-binding protein n=1 Tax=Paenibacillus profundus TaxID=1173085 RepID=A0ABS8YR77_9BACL|nr:extracellular solute-binding protein [Paenibacillus profundus]MCE5172807.1 extracellular solute-binding protein [Paenibacillus profundus]